ncbi:hypothetical protein V6N12_011573 [Hibiscus sabdariffa]|uniref:Gamma-tubulin complex component n=1 Tax=Hibiscus sabdariffa TaxID=183260 RepID=A0ABR2AZK4_9ROSI
MLHELLLALVGYTGDLIIDEREHQKSLGIHLHPDAAISGHRCFKLAPDISFIDPSERDLIERLIALGFYYRELDRFATKSRNLSWIRSGGVSLSPLDGASELSSHETESPSVYRRAIGNGLVEELSVYRSAVLQIEQKLLSETMPVLATVTQGLNKFFVILPPLYELVLEIERHDLRGGKLLNLLHKRFHCGVPELQACIQRLLWHGHQVLYNQLASWMVYGVLQDQHGEFFIRRQEDRDVEYGSFIPDTSDKLARLSADDKSSRDWHFGFHIFLDMLPEYIPMRTAESILFAGKSIRILRNPTPGFKFQDALYNQQKGKCSQKVHGSAGCDPFPKEPINGNMIGEEFLPQSEADKIETMLQELKESLEFHKRSFECSVESIRTVAASHLWQLVVVRADLNGHLKALKDYFLLAKGDFFQCFLEESRQLMRLPPRPSTAEAEITVPFQLAAIKTISEGDRYFSRVSLRMPSFGIPVKSSQVDLSNASSETPLDGWDGIALEYFVDWPLTAVLYARSSLQVPYNFPVSAEAETNTNGIGEIMGIYVIESQWKVLQSHIQNSQDFTELVGLHQEYLSALISQSFLDIGSVSRILGSIMVLCLQFCWNIENQDSSEKTSELERITEEFNKKSNSLYTILRSSRLSGSQRAPFLRRFLLRMNFNSFFEATARGVLNVVRPRPSVPVSNQQTSI